MSAASLETKNIDLTLNGQKILKKINFAVPAGKTATIIGPSGSGKSSFLRVLNRIYEPNAGEILLNNASILNLKKSKLCEHIGMVFQNFNLFPNYDVLNNVTLALRKVKKMDKTAAETIALEKLKLVGLDKKANSKIYSLSGGQKQRVAIARALAMEPEIMLFDEATSALDPELVKSILNLMTDLAKTGMTMIVVTHEMRFARNVSDELYFMAEGEILESGKPEQLFNHPQSPRLKQFLNDIL